MKSQSVFVEFLSILALTFVIAIGAGVGFVAVTMVSRVATEHRGLECFFRDDKAESCYK